MSKIWLIIKREYLTRVRSRTFILSTFLFPIIMIGFIAAATYFSVKSVETQRIAVKDKSGLFKNQLKNSPAVSFTFLDDVNKSNYRSKGFEGVLIIPNPEEVPRDTSIVLISEKQLGMATDDAIRKEINSAMENKMLLEHGIDSKVLDSIRSHSENSAFSFQALQVKGSEVKKSNSGTASIIGFASGLLIYITLFIYGAAVMRGVMEEKMNRIAEVMVSSVKPFQLMMGKIVGIAGVGLTQFLMWIILILTITTTLTAFIPSDVMHQVQQANQNMPGAAGPVSTMGNQQNYKAMAEVLNSVGQNNWFLLIFCFLFYFVGGYLFYASLFAAVGSVVNEDPQEAQSLMLPITMPIVLSFIIMANTISNPSSSMAVWGSIIPFSSPIVMMARLPFGVPGTVPYWQLGLSLVSLVVGFLLTTWLSGKIYRTGILLYGKKVSLREVGKWAFRKS
ncbi:MAG: ABC transporter permease [Bacteroidetes bacterium]|nr:MAG: ABC transporter permease [Bacteroidota bacterium]